MATEDYMEMTGAEYEQMYARFLRRPVDEMLLAAGQIEGMMVMDVCAGGMRLSKRAFELGADSVLAIDASEKMMSTGPDGVARSVQDVSEWKPSSHPGLRWHRVYCQQGINYWFARDPIAKIAQELLDDGVFIFNTFSKKPDEVPARKEYMMNGHNFVEVGWVVGDTVVHVQTLDDRSHLSTFKWISHADFMRILGDFFDVQWRDDGPARMYICQKKRS